MFTHSRSWSSHQYTCLSIRLDGVQCSKRISAADNVGVPPELSAGQLQHLSEDRVSAQLTGQCQAGETSVILDVGISILTRMSVLTK